MLKGKETQQRPWRESVQAPQHTGLAMDSRVGAGGGDADDGDEGGNGGDGDEADDVDEDSDDADDAGGGGGPNPSTVLIWGDRP